MTNFLSPDKLLRLILKEQSHLYPKPTVKATPLEDSYLNEFSESENSVKVIFDHANLKILYISDNVPALTGYTEKDFGKASILFALKLITLDHFNFMYVWLQWAIGIHAELGDLNRAKQAVCGVQLKHKDGHVMRILFRHIALEMAESGAVKVAAISIDDITHLIKGNFYWGRMAFDDREQDIHHFISTDKKDVQHDIISDREKEVLRLLALGKESKEIAESLFLSSHTVDNHRRNMIARTGAKDTTALVQICRMAGII
jgi:DNA-binding CsgD family transcriptional regulator